MEGARPALLADVPTLAALARDAVKEQAEDRGGHIWSQRETRPLPAEASLLVAVDDPNQLVVAGTIDNVILGFGAVGLETLRNGQILGVVSDLYVDAGAREVGVGEAIIECLLEWCRSRNCQGVDALALPGNRQTKNFFESFGFTARAIVVHRRLDPPNPASPASGP